MAHILLEIDAEWLTVGGRLCMHPLVDQLFFKFLFLGNHSGKSAFHLHVQHLSLTDG